MQARDPVVQTERVFGGGGGVGGGYDHHPHPHPHHLHDMRSMCVYFHVNVSPTNIHVHYPNSWSRLGFRIDLRYINKTLTLAS